MQNAIRKEKNLKIALMGHSAGGHLALLYAYKSKLGGVNGIESEIPVSLVISEAGPTNFTLRQDVLEGVASDQARMEYLLARNDEEESWENKLSNVSPINYVTFNAPYTILAYGNGKDMHTGPNSVVSGDGTIPYSQATSLCTSLSNNGVQVNLYPLNGVEHDQFGDDENSNYPFTVCPTSTEGMVYEYYYGKEENGKLGLKQLINNHLFGNN